MGRINDKNNAVSGACLAGDAPKDDRGLQSDAARLNREAALALLDVARMVIEMKGAPALRNGARLRFVRVGARLVNVYHIVVVGADLERHLCILVEWRDADGKKMSERLEYKTAELRDAAMAKWEEALNAA